MGRGPNNFELWSIFGRMTNCSTTGSDFIIHKSRVNSVDKIEGLQTLYYTIYNQIVLAKGHRLTSMIDDRACINLKLTTTLFYFKAKLGKRSDNKLKVGNFCYGGRNFRGQPLADFVEKEGL